MTQLLIFTIVLLISSIASAGRQCLFYGSARPFYEKTTPLSSSLLSFKQTYMHEEEEEGEGEKFPLKDLIVLNEGEFITETFKRIFRNSSMLNVTFDGYYMSPGSRIEVNGNRILSGERVLRTIRLEKYIFHWGYPKKYKFNPWVKTLLAPSGNTILVEKQKRIFFRSDRNLRKRRTTIWCGTKKRRIKLKETHGRDPERVFRQRFTVDKLVSKAPELIQDYHPRVPIRFSISAQEGQASHGRHN